MRAPLLAFLILSGFYWGPAVSIALGVLLWILQAARSLTGY